MARLVANYASPCRLDRFRTTEMARIGTPNCEALREQNSCQSEACLSPATVKLCTPFSRRVSLVTRGLISGDARSSGEAAQVLVECRSGFYPGFHIRGCKQEPGDRTRQKTNRDYTQTRLESDRQFGSNSAGSYSGSVRFNTLIY